MKKKPSLKPRVASRLNLKNKFAFVIATGSFAVVAFIIFSIFGNLGAPEKSIAAPGKDGSKTVSSSNVILNEYTYLTANAPVDAVVLNVANSNLNSNGRFTSNLAAGDLLMIIQMQGAWIRHNDDSSSTWGAVLAYNNCGNFEFAEVASIASGSKINLAKPLAKSYSVAGKVQVVRVPRYTTLTITSGGSVTAPAWDGSTGGIVAMEASLTTLVNGSINVTGKGFRGGIVEQNSNIPGNHAIYASTSSSNGGEKGEGIAGYQTNYDTIYGRYGRGAPANGGGGGNSHNASGGGGANAGTLALWTGLGNPDNSVSNWTTAWNLESAGFALTTSSGGGRGGYTYSATAKNPLTVAPNTSSWTGDNRYNVGGYGGRPLDYTTGRIFMGGGGGAGDSNDGTGTSGATGGGIVYLLGGGNISGTGSINANGASAGTTTTSTGWDGSGGGGGGGAVVIYSKGSISSITINVTGGVGGNQNIVGDPEAEGAGGGGGGGYISLSNSSGVTTNYTGGKQGATNTSSMVNFTPNGGTKGGPGLIGSPPSSPYSSGGLPVKLISFTAKIIEEQTQLEWVTAAEINNDYFTIEKSADGINFNTFLKIDGVGNSTSLNEYKSTDEHPFDGFNYYRLKQTDFNGATEYFSVVSVENKKESVGDTIEIKKVRPNPFRENFSVEFDTDAEGEYALELLDISGRTVAVEKFQAYAGFNDVSFNNTSKLRKGIYYLRVNGGKLTSKAVKIVKQ